MINPTTLQTMIIPIIFQIFNNIPMKFNNGAKAEYSKNIRDDDQINNMADDIDEPNNIPNDWSY